MSYQLVCEALFTKKPGIKITKHQGNPTSVVLTFPRDVLVKKLNMIKAKFIKSQQKEGYLVSQKRTIRSLDRKINKISQKPDAQKLYTARISYNLWYTYKTNKTYGIKTSMKTAFSGKTV